MDIEPKFNAKQQAQEDGYAVPYHWFKKRDTMSGRLYFGYLDLCERLMAEAVGTGKGLKLLDAGCGDARLLGQLREHGYTDLTGTDFSARATAFARLLVPSAQIVQADLMKEVPLPAASFDAVFLIETLEHIPPEDVAKVLANLRTLLKPDGALIVTVPSVLHGMPAPESGDKHYQHFTEATLRRNLEPVFARVRILGQDHGAFHPLKVAYRLLENAWWTVPPLARAYNLRVWPKRFNVCPTPIARRLVAVCQK